MIGYIRTLCFNALAWIFSHRIYQWIAINISHCRPINISTSNGNYMRRGATNVYIEGKSHVKSLCRVNPQSSFTIKYEAVLACFEFNLQWQKSQLHDIYIW